MAPVFFGQMQMNTEYTSQSLFIMTIIIHKITSKMYLLVDRLFCYLKKKKKKKKKISSVILQGVMASIPQIMLNLSILLNKQTVRNTVN